MFAGMARDDKEGLNTKKIEYEVFLQNIENSLNGFIKSNPTLDLDANQIDFLFAIKKALIEHKD